MRRLASIALLLLTGLPLIAPLFAWGGVADAASWLPACCRRNGAHHCAMSAGELAARFGSSNAPVAQAHCTIWPVPGGTFDHQQVLFVPGSPIFAEAMSHPAQHWQVEAWARVALDGARQKRGPPGASLC